MVLQKFEDVGSEASDQLENNWGSGGCDFQSFADAACKFIFTHSQFELGFLLHGQVLRKESDQLFRRFSRDLGVYDAQGHIAGLKWIEGLRSKHKYCQLGNSGECLEISDLFLHTFFTGASLIETFQFEESVADGALEQDE